MNKKIIAAFVSLALFLGLSGGMAFAWTYGLSGMGECQTDGSFKITWTVDNTAEDEALNITASSNTSVVPVGTQIPASQTEDFSQTVDGTKADSFNLSLTGSFSSDQTLRTKEATVTLDKACDQPGGMGGGPEDKVTLCHATDSNTNPYVKITVDSAGAYNGHYSQHQGPIFPGSGGKWGDIIPTFSFNGQSYSLNWTATGQAIYNAGCQVGGQGGGPQVDCDGDFDNSPASECTGGQGGGTVTPPTTGGQGGGTVVTPAVSTTVTATTGGQGAGVTTTPTGGVNAGEGMKVASSSAIAGLLASIVSIGLGIRRLRGSLL